MDIATDGNVQRKRDLTCYREVFFTRNNLGTPMHLRRLPKRGYNALMCLELKLPDMTRLEISHLLSK